ncbi:hypothetical protein TNCV_1619631 [Trichonephila clavipes]|nr:hypothetical protein TNCV_1619631 [Trichonephila clavipes]
MYNLKTTWGGRDAVKGDLKNFFKVVWLGNSGRHHTAILESAGPPDDSANVRKKAKPTKGLNKISEK